MNGIVFFSTDNLNRVVRFYKEQLGCTSWLEQSDCEILKGGELLIGFCQRDKVDRCGIVCFFYDSRGEVDLIYKKLAEVSDAPPRENRKYGIYQFFAKDPDGRTIEFQAFDKEKAGE
ncbi:MAG: VOC family protein [bacterium]|nr:VOC family protein [bacterium]